AFARGAATRTAQADEDRALFWRVETPDGGRGIAFGYARVAAAMAPDIVADGNRLVEGARRGVLDMGNFEGPAIKNARKVPPKLPRLEPGRADEVRNILLAMQLPQAQLEKLPGFVVATVLYGEGQVKPVPSVGGTIMEHAKALGRPVTTLLNRAET